MARAAGEVGSGGGVDTRVTMARRMIACDAAGGRSAARVLATRGYRPWVGRDGDDGDDDDDDDDCGGCGGAAAAGGGTDPLVRRAARRATMDEVTPMALPVRPAQVAGCATAGLRSGEGLDTAAVTGGGDTGAGAGDTGAVSADRSATEAAHSQRRRTAAATVPPGPPCHCAAPPAIEVVEPCCVSGRASRTAPASDRAIAGSGLAGGRGRHFTAVVSPPVASSRPAKPASLTGIMATTSPVLGLRRSMARAAAPHRVHRSVLALAGPEPSARRRVERAVLRPCLVECATGP